MLKRRPTPKLFVSYCTTRIFYLNFLVIPIHRLSCVYTHFIKAYLLVMQDMFNLFFLLIQIMNLSTFSGLQNYIYMYMRFSLFSIKCRDQRTRIKLKI